MTNTNPALVAFNQLNERMSALVQAKLQVVLGTPDERDVLRTLTQQGIDSSDEILALIAEGLTYEKWKAFLAKINRVDGPLAIFENEAGDLAQLLKEFVEGDLESAFAALEKDGFFKASTIEQDKAQLQQRLEWAEKMWAQHDEVDKQIQTLQDIDTTEEPK